MSSFGFFHHIALRAISRSEDTVTLLAMCVYFICFALFAQTHYILPYNIYFFKSKRNCLQFIYNFLIRFFFLSSSQHRYSSGESFTSTVSSPIHSILHHGITKSSDLQNPKNPFERGTMIAVILPSLISNSKSEGQPSIVPSQTLTTSFSLSSQVLKRSIYISSLKIIRASARLF